MPIILDLFVLDDEQKQKEKEILMKWERTGLLEGLLPQQKINISKMLENEKEFLKNKEDDECHI